jgi:hypothetical protein
MKLKNKKAVEAWLTMYETYFEYDAEKDKYYFVFEDVERGGQYTLMCYKSRCDEYGEFFTIHGKGENYCDSDEKFLIFDEVVSFVWKNRKYIHKELK